MIMINYNHVQSKAIFFFNLKKNLVSSRLLTMSPLNENQQILLQMV